MNVKFATGKQDSGDSWVVFDPKEADLDIYFE